MDVKDEDVVKQCLSTSGLAREAILKRAFTSDITQRLEESMNLFEKAACPGVPTWVVEGERYWVKDRVDWLAEKVKSLLK